MPISEFNKHYLQPLLQKIDTESKTCSLIGDFNINLLNIDSSKDTLSFFNIMVSSFFMLFILQPTRLSEQSKTHIFDQHR